MLAMDDGFENMHNRKKAERFLAKEVSPKNSIPTPGNKEPAPTTNDFEFKDTVLENNPHFKQNDDDFLNSEIEYEKLPSGAIPIKWLIVGLILLSLPIIYFFLLPNLQPIKKTQPIKKPSTTKVVKDIYQQTKFKSIPPIEIGKFNNKIEKYSRAIRKTGAQEASILITQFGQDWSSILNAEEGGLNLKYKADILTSFIFNVTKDIEEGDRISWQLEILRGVQGQEVLPWIPELHFDANSNNIPSKDKWKKTVLDNESVCNILMKYNLLQLKTVFLLGKNLKCNISEQLKFEKPITITKSPIKPLVKALKSEFISINKVPHETFEVYIVGDQ